MILKKLIPIEEVCVENIYGKKYLWCTYRALPGYTVCGVHLKKRMADHKKTHPDYEPVSISDIKEAYRAEIYNQKKQGKDEG